MTIDVEIGGRVRRVGLQHTDHRWVASIDGREIALDAVNTPAGWSLILHSGSGGTSYDVDVEDRGSGELMVHVDGASYDARIVVPRVRGRGGRAGTAGAGHAGLRQITAPMPGRIARVLVTPGERVVARQGLVVVEAMKMENELRAPADASVREVRVTPGASVEAGSVLVVLE